MEDGARRSYRRHFFRHRRASQGKSHRRNHQGEHDVNPRRPPGQTDAHQGRGGGGVSGAGSGWRPQRSPVYRMDDAGDQPLVGGSSRHPNTISCLGDGFKSNPMPEGMPRRKCGQLVSRHAANSACHGGQKRACRPTSAKARTRSPDVFSEPFLPRRSEGRSVIRVVVRFSLKAAHTAPARGATDKTSNNRFLFRRQCT